MLSEEDVKEATFPEPRLALQEAMVFLGAIASGMEEAVGESASSISYLAGKNLGKTLSNSIPKTDDLEQALEATRTVLFENGFLWLFEPFKTHDRPSMVIESDDGREITLVFRDCMIRQSLFRFGHAQKGSLCTMMNGFFAGALQNIMGTDSTLEIVHAGENACMKKLTVRRPGGNA
jgi:predicted hydrocarbon binding protein